MRYQALAALLATLVTAPAWAADHVVEIRDMSFQPAALSVAAGDTVTFVNRDAMPHTATADGGGFDTGRIDSGKAVRVTIGSAGSLAYRCAIHTAMTGQIAAQ